MLFSFTAQNEHFLHKKAVSVNTPLHDRNNKLPTHTYMHTHTHTHLAGVHSPPHVPSAEHAVAQSASVHVRLLTALVRDQQHTRVQQVAGPIPP